MDKNLLQTTGEYVKETASWEWLKYFTDARIALGRTGCSLLTQDYLNFSMAHAKAKDAIQTPFDRENLRLRLQELGLKSLYVESAAHDRPTFLARPDLGRQLDEHSKDRLTQLN